jgi:hypothetical protein
MISLLARSAMVRASLKTRWNARAESCSRWVAAHRIGCAAASTSQWARLSRLAAGPISALQVIGMPANRFACTARAAFTRARTVVERSLS